MLSARKNLADRAWQLALVVAAVVAVVRIAQPGGDSPQIEPGVAQLHSTKPDRPGAALDAELAQLYAACPMAAVVDFETVAASPERAVALLPPYQPTAERVVDAANTTAPRAGQWLVDPDQWFTPEERAKRDAAAEKNSSSNNKPAAERESPAIRPPAVVPPAKETKQAPANRGPGLPFAAPPLPLQPGQSPAIGAQNRPSTNPPSTPPALFSPPATPIAEPADLPLPTTTPAAQPSNPPNAQPAPNTPVFAAPPARPSAEAIPAPANKAQDGIDPHLALFARNAYPSARDCAKCHEDIYHDWSISAHAYAAVSPMFHKFEQKLNDISQGTIGYFCVRCHAPVATNLNISRAEPIWNQPEVAREGITCVACHRVQYIYGKSNGERRIEAGDIFAPVFGGIGGAGVAETIRRKDEFKVKTSPDEKGPGQEMHVAGIYFEPLTKSEFCTPCHQVAVHPGIKLEVVWEQYRASPACKKGISCQDCHMGRVPGRALGYDVGPVAKVADKIVNDGRKKSNHVFFGPNYSIAHPGVFPFHLKSNRWTIDQWLLFDWRAGWGTDAFEERVAGMPKGSVVFPECWAESDDRRDAREILDENIKKLDRKRELRVEIMENGSHVEGPCFTSQLRCGQDLAFHFVVTNTNEGHNLLTASLGAQPQLWANVALIGPGGERLWETGYTDCYGDLANIHSVEVRNGRLPFDAQLFNLQTMFLITGAKGTDREFYVPVNVDIDQLPFIRPGVQPISVINHPPFIRMESQSLAPLGSREARYVVPGNLLRAPGKYRLSFRMRSRAEPMYLMRFCDATVDMQRSMNEWMIDLHQKSVEFEVQ